MKLFDENFGFHSLRGRFFATFATTTNGFTDKLHLQLDLSIGGYHEKI